MKDRLRKFAENHPAEITIVCAMVLYGASAYSLGVRNTKRGFKIERVESWHNNKDGKDYWDIFYQSGKKKTLKLVYTEAGKVAA